jgi:hypothetical protein
VAAGEPVVKGWVLAACLEDRPPTWRLQLPVVSAVADVLVDIDDHPHCQHPSR